MIYTSSHKNCDSNLYRTVAISGNRGRDANYIGEYYPALAPKLTFWKIWHNNIGIISDIENNKYYIDKYFEEVLSKLDAEKIYKDLDDSILLCYEDSNLFCHRHIVSAWLEHELKIEVPECHVINDELKIVDKDKWIKDYLIEKMENNNKLILKKVIK